MNQEPREKLTYDRAIKLLTAFGKRLEKGYDEISANRDYVHRPDIALEYIRREKELQEQGL